MSWGSAEFVAQEELERETGHWWSPDDAARGGAGRRKPRSHIVKRAAIGADGTGV